MGRRSGPQWRRAAVPLLRDQAEGALRGGARGLPPPCQIAAAFAAAEAAWRHQLQEITVAHLVAQVAAESSPEHIGEVVSWLGANVTELPGGGA